MTCHFVFSVVQQGCFKFGNIYIFLIFCLLPRHLILEFLKIVPFVYPNLFLLIRVRYHEVLVQLFSIISDPIHDVFYHIKIFTILHNKSLFCEETSLKSEKAHLFVDNFLFITKSKIESLAIDITPSIYGILGSRAHQVRRFKLLVQNTLSIIFNFDIITILNVLSVSRVHVIDYILIDSPVLLKVEIILNVSIYIILIKTVFLVLHIFLHHLFRP